MKAARIVVAILSTLVISPIWFYLMYKILVGVHATELMWFLFWVYVPIAVLCGVITRVVETK